MVMTIKISMMRMRMRMLLLIVDHVDITVYKMYDDINGDVDVDADVVLVVL